MYVADTGNSRIEKFDSNGGFLTEWGSEGTGDGQFSNPKDVAVDGSGNVYVADTNNDRIQKFDSEGKFLTEWGTEGSRDGEFSNPRGVTVDDSGDVYVADTGNHRIQKFDPNGRFLTEWGTKGLGNGDFNYPCDLAVDSSGNVYVADSWNFRIQKFRPVGMAVEPADKLAVSWGSIKESSGLPSSFVLKQNYPNPFNPETWIPYQLAEDSEVTIRIYNAAGQLIRRLSVGYKEAGLYITKDAAAYWDGRADSGEYVSSGVYFYNIRAGGYSATKKMIAVQ